MRQAKSVGQSTSVLQEIGVPSGISNRAQPDTAPDKTTAPTNNRLM
jgi:hypothetical protein